MLTLCVWSVPDWRIPELTRSSISLQALYMFTFIKPGMGAHFLPQVQTSSINMDVSLPQSSQLPCKFVALSSAVDLYEYTLSIHSVLTTVCKRGLKYPPHCPNGSVEVETSIRALHTDTGDGYIHARMYARRHTPLRSHRCKQLPFLTLRLPVCLWLSARNTGKNC